MEDIQTIRGHIKVGASQNDRREWKLKRRSPSDDWRLFLLEWRVGTKSFDVRSAVRVDWAKESQLEVVLPTYVNRRRAVCVYGYSLIGRVYGAKKK